MSQAQKADVSPATWPGGIAAITLFVEDLAEAKRFYADVFGLPVAFEDELGRLQVRRDARQPARGA